MGYLVRGKIKPERQNRLPDAAGGISAGVESRLQEPSGNEWLRCCYC